MSILSKDSLPVGRVKSREEIRFVLLLDKTESHCAQIVAQKESKQANKIKFYVTNLGEMIKQLEKHAQAPPKEVLHDYESKVTFLKNVLDDLDLQDDPVPRFGVDIQQLGIKETDPVYIKGVSDDFCNPVTSTSFLPLPKVKTYRPIPHIVGNNNKKVREIHQAREQKHLSKDRKALFGDEDEAHGFRPSTSDADLNDLLKAHHQAQEQVAEEMLTLAKSLKEQTLAAGEIIKKDTQTLERTSELADKNTGRLAVETERLSEHTKRSCRCWIWFLLLVVTFTFISMVMVMKIFRKRTWSYEQKDEL